MLLTRCSKAFVLFVSVLLGPAGSLAGDSDGLVVALEGVYKNKVRSATIAPGKDPGEEDRPYVAEDIVEIVRYAPGQIYFRAKMNFYNGHSCGISGIATSNADGFVFRDKEILYEGARRCVLTIRTTGRDLVLDDRSVNDERGTCSDYCGARGTLSKISIPMATRRPIRYLKRLRASTEYSRAVERFNAAPPNTPLQTDGASPRR